MNEKEFEEQLQALSERVLSKALSPEEEANYTESLFESIRHVNEYGEEFWYARELQIALEYKQWRRFCSVIDKAKEACKGSGNIISDHFANVGKMVNIGSGAERELEDMTGFFYACFIKAACAVRTAGTVGMHMIPDVIRRGNDGKMNAVMTVLCARLLPRGFAEASVLFYRWLLKSV